MTSTVRNYGPRPSMPYPSFYKLAPHLYRSIEERDGKPDFLLVRDKGKWHVKWRTSAHWSGGTYDTVQDAIKAVRKDAAFKLTS